VDVENCSGDESELTRSRLTVDAVRCRPENADEERDRAVWSGACLSRSRPVEAT
jgi:hypothetical protein